MLADYLIDLNEQNFQSTLELSKKTPLMVYFWANMVPESVELNQTLVTLAHEYNGAFILASLDCEQHQMLAAQFGIQSLPTLALFVNGEPVDGLAGPQTQTSIREMLARHLPSQDEMTLKSAFQQIEQGLFDEAISQLKLIEQVYAELADYKLALASCYVETDQFEKAQEILSTVLMQDQDGRYKSLMARIALYQQEGDSEEIRRLQQAFQENPTDHKLGYELALELSKAKQQKPALDILLAILQKDLNFADGEAKKTMMDILSALGQKSELAGQYRRKLYSLLY